MQLPSADELRAIFRAAREEGITRLRLTADGLEADVSLVTPADMVAEINKRAPLPPDPLAVVTGAARATENREPADVLDVLASGARLVETGNPDPTAPS